MSEAKPVVSASGGPDKTEAKKSDSLPVLSEDDVHSELRKKRRVRGGHRSSCTRVLGEAGYIMSVAREEHCLEAKSRNTLRMNLTFLKRKVTLLETLDEDILALSSQVEDDNTVEQEIVDADEWTMKLATECSDIDEALQLPVAGQNTPNRATDINSVAEQEDTVVMANESSSSIRSTGGSGGRVKLPKLELGKFAGDAMQWQTFFDGFKSLIHDNADLTAVDKFTYLRSSLQGAAAAVISGMSLTEANYEAAMKSLQDRYGDPQRIISAHMDALLNIASVASEHDLPALRKLMDGVLSHVRSLENLGRKTQHYGDMFVPILLQKLPKAVRLDICKAISESSALDEVLEQLKVELRSRERCAYVASQSTGDSTPPPKQEKKSIPTASSLNATSKSTPPTCVYCGQHGHLLAACAVVTSVSKRKDILLRQRRCFVCTKRGHIAMKCRSASRCTKCNGRHHVTICEAQHTFNGACSVGTGHQTATLLQTARATANAPDESARQCPVRLLFDLGSQRSYITNRVRNHLQLEAQHTENLAIQGFGIENGTPKSVDIVNVNIATPEDGPVSLVAIAVPVISGPICQQYPTQVAATHSQLASLRLADDGEGNATVDILVGADQYWQFATGETMRLSDDLVAMATKLGWLLSGAAEAPSSPSTTHMFAVTSEQLDEQLKRFWDIESLGITAQDPDQVQVNFDDTVCLEGGYYTVRLPWREEHPVLPDNFTLSQKRLLSLTAKLETRPVLFQQYADVMQQQLAAGIIEEVPDDNNGEVGDVHYIPHHAVVRDDKATTKVRVVYDGSAHIGQCPSINSCLMSGPNLLETIPDILLRFRSHRVALTGDIEKAFLMLSVSEEDRDRLRLLWWDDPFSPQRKVKAFRFTRVMFGLTCSPFLLNATLQHHLEQYRESDPEFVERVLNSMYVDDLASGSSSDDGTLQLHAKLKSCLAEGGFNIRKFQSSSPAVQEYLDEAEDAAAPSNSKSAADEDLTYAKLSLNGTHQENSKVLGVTWDRQSDEIIMDVASVFTAVEKVPTKRAVASQVARVFDPLGMVTPLTVKLKMFLQALHKDGLDWDTPLSAAQEAEWQSLIAAFEQAAPLRLQRCYFSSLSDNATVSLHGFCDASQGAFAAVIYLRVQSGDTSEVQFVMAKSRVAPTAAQTIPRLELLGALTLARLMVAVRDALEKVITISEVHCWTDSRVALGWITNREQEWKQFVQNRVNEIRRLTSVDVWGFCPGTLNPADIPSRGISPGELQSTMWLTGPAWLRESACPPDHGSKEGGLPEECKQEMKKSAQVTCLESSATPVSSSSNSSIGTIMSSKRYSTYHKLLRVTANVLKFVKLLRKQDVSAQELTDEAQRMWLLDIQHNAPSAASRIEKAKVQLGIFKDDRGLLRCGGRLQSAELSSAAKHPVLLCPGHHVTELIVQECHRRVMHNGVAETLTELRSQFWIVRGRQYVKTIIHRCRLCKLLEGKPYIGPPPPPLSEFRTRIGHPFEHTGVDFAGPFYVRAGQDNQKTYLVLYTCAVTRAVHLDLVADLNTSTFLRSFRRFVARRGLPAVVKSDNGKTFKAAARLLRDLGEESEIQNYLQARNIRWTFNLEKAPWWGGFFERLIKSVKRCVKKTLRTAQVTADELLTLLTDVEAILNSRPLTYVASDDVREPLTPSHLLCGHRVLSMPDMTSNPQEESVTLTRRYMYLQELLQHFWSRWTKEYLMELRASHRIGCHSDEDTISVGDVVVIHQDGVQRGLWKVGIVESLRPSDDGRVRGAAVRTTTKSGRTTTLQRPIQRLFPVEKAADGSDKAASTTVDTTADTVQQAEQTPSRPRRAAAQAAEKTRRQLVSSKQL